MRGHHQQFYVNIFFYCCEVIMLFNHVVHMILFAVTSLKCFSHIQLVQQHQSLRLLDGMTHGTKTEAYHNPGLSCLKKKEKKKKQVVEFVVNWLRVKCKSCIPSKLLCTLQHIKHIMNVKKQMFVTFHFSFHFNNVYKFTVTKVTQLADTMNTEVNCRKMSSFFQEC